MPIWKIPLITAAAKKVATVAAPAVSRAVAALTNRAPAATAQVAQAAKKVAPLVTRAGGGSLRAAETLARGAAKAAPAVAAGYGLSRLAGQPTTAPPRTSAAPPVVTPVALPPTQRPFVGAPQQPQTTQPRVAPTAPGVTVPAAAPVAAPPVVPWWASTPPATVYPQHDSGAGTGASASSGADTFAPIITELTDILRSLQTDEGSAVSAHHLNQFLAETDRMGAEIRTMFEEQMGTVDPATMAALGAIRETVNAQRGRLMDDMNRRGLLQSGIWLQMEDRINNNQLSAEQQALSTRLTNLRGQMTGALQNLANARLEGTRALSIEGLRAAEDQAQRRQQATLGALGVAQDAAGQAAAQQRWAAEQTTEQQRWTAEQTREANEFNLRYNTLLADLTGRIPGGMPGAGQPTADAQQRAIQNAPRATQQRAGGGTAPAGTLTERTRAATADAHTAVDAAMAQGATPEAIKNNIRRQTAALIRDGVNVDSLLLYVDEAHLRNMQMRPPATAPQTPGLYTRIDQQLGGWLPWGAPRG